MRVVDWSGATLVNPEDDAPPILDVIARTVKAVLAATEPARAPACHDALTAFGVKLSETPDLVSAVSCARLGSRHPQGHPAFVRGGDQVRQRGGAGVAARAPGRGDAIR